MTRPKPCRQALPANRKRRDIPSPEVAAAYRAELTDRLINHNAIVSEKARRAGWIAQPDGGWFHPVHTPNGVQSPRLYSLEF